MTERASKPDETSREVNRRRILIVSNNPLSTTENNGKTFASFFKHWPDVQLMQLYFRPELPDEVCTLSPDEPMLFYQLTDRQVLRGGSGHCFEYTPAALAQTALQTSDSEPAGAGGLYRARFRSWPSVKLSRELMWSLYPFERKNPRFFELLEAFRPELIFFCAGDAMFAYHIVSVIQKRTGCPLALYITDDYILPYSRVSPFTHWRRAAIRKCMLNLGRSADAVFTIGDLMQQTYSEQFGLKSDCLVNMSDDHDSPVDYAARAAHPPLRLVYAGGLHYDRDLVLRRIAAAMQRVNERLGYSAFKLDIYAPPVLSPGRLAALSSPCSVYHGKISADEVETESRAADILLFVESAHPRAVRFTALSLSTKVPEYQSYRRAILSVGSDASASVRYLKTVGFWAADDVSAIEQVLETMAHDPGLLQVQADAAHANFQRHHRPEQVRQVFRRRLMAVLQPGMPGAGGGL